MLRSLRAAGKYAFVLSSITGLRAITPLSFLYCIYCITYPPQSLPFIVLAVYTALECLFYLFVFLPLKKFLQQPAEHPAHFTREQRRMLYQRCIETISDPEAYIGGWFRYGDLDEIKQENVKEFLTWSLWHGDSAGVDPEELQEYVDSTGAMLGRTFAPGRGTAKCLKVTIDEVGMLHRPLLWYLIIGMLDAFVAIRLYYYGFTFHRPLASPTISGIPPRPHAALTTLSSPSKAISYWYRPHKSTTKHPILFIHGIGIGLWPYVDFLAEVIARDPDVGIIAVEIMSISARIADPVLLTADIRAEVNKILEAHNWEKSVVVANSYGTIITTQIFHDPLIRPKIASMLLVDPVTFLLHMPDVAYNVTARSPSKTSEWVLWYFSAKDMGVAHTLHRRSFWQENIMWKEDVEGMDVTVALAGQDIIVPAEEVARYISGDTDRFRKRSEKRVKEFKQKPWEGKGLEILWYQDADHASVFDYKSWRRPLVDVVERYCWQEAGEAEKYLKAKKGSYFMSG